MTGFGVAAIVFGAVGVALILYTLLYTPRASPGTCQSGATHSGRDGARKVRDDFDQRARTTVLADNPPGPTSIRNPNACGSTSAS